MQAVMAKMNHEYFMNLNLFESTSKKTQVVLVCLYEKIKWAVKVDVRTGNRKRCY